MRNTGRSWVMTMIKSTDFITESARKEAEQLALAQLLSSFTDAMASKVMQKVEKGYVGWDQPQIASVLEQKLTENLQKGDMIDVANLAMMLWNLQQK